MIVGTKPVAMYVATEVTISAFRIAGPYKDNLKFNLKGCSLYFFKISSLCTRFLVTI